jgi:hypothetical protein
MPDVIIHSAAYTTVEQAESDSEVTLEPCSTKEFPRPGAMPRNSVLGHFAINRKLDSRHPNGEGSRLTASSSCHSISL